MVTVVFQVKSVLQAIEVLVGGVVWLELQAYQDLVDTVA